MRNHEHSQHSQDLKSRRTGYVMHNNADVSVGHAFLRCSCEFSQACSSVLLNSFPGFSVGATQNKITPPPPASAMHACINTGSCKKLLAAVTCYKWQTRCVGPPHWWKGSVAAAKFCTYCQQIYRLLPKALVHPFANPVRFCTANRETLHLGGKYGWGSIKVWGCK